ncbi:MAG: Asp23/Gls24 family envelope stress response protein [Bacilli bacterium]|nr:Asp23/Gls24 family envelope stress response protein [Bacilli bacterium]
MTIEKISSTGGIDISTNAIASVVGSAAIECYGVVGLSARHGLRDNVDNLLGRENFQQGVTCEKDKKKGYIVNVYIIVANDTKITEVANELQKKIKYVLEKTFGIKFNKVNIYVQGVREIN